MKADKKIVEEIANNLEEELEDFIRRIRTYIKLLREATEVEDVMRLKQDILMTWIADIPISSNTCYFCIKNEDPEDGINCRNCEYAKHHGICEEEGSSWMKINKLVCRLYNLIENEYYKDEEYGQEA